MLTTTALAAMGVGAASTGLGLAVRSATRFQESMTNVQAVLGATDDDVLMLSQDILAIGAASRAGPQAAADAFYDIVGGVADASTHMAILEAAIATAEAGSADLGATTSGLISIMNSYGFSAEEAAFASDVLTQTVGAGVGSMDEFAAALPQVAGLASSLGVDFDSLGASMAFLTTKGFSASQSATQLKAMMTALINPNTMLTQSLEEAGFASGQAAIEQLGLVGAYNALIDASPTFQNNMAASVGSVEALNGVIALTDESFSAFEDDFKSSAEGATAAARSIQLNSLNAQLDLLKSSFEGVKIAIGMAVIPALTRLVRGVTGAMPTIQRIALVVMNFADALMHGRRWAAEAGEALGFLLGNTDKANKVAWKLVDTFFQVKDVLEAAATAALDFARDLASAFSEGGLQAVGELLADKLIAGLSAITNILGGWVEDNIITPIRNAFEADGLAGVGQLILDKIAPAAGVVGAWVNDNIIQPIVDAFEGADWTPATRELGVITDAIGKINPASLLIIAAGLGAMAAPTVVAGLASAAASVVAMAGSAVGLLAAAVPLLIIAGIALAIQTNFGGIADAIDQVSEGLKKGDLQMTLDGILDSLLAIPMGIAEWVGSQIGIDVPEGLKGWQTAIEAIKQIAIWIGDQLVGIFNGVAFDVADGVTGFETALKSIKEIAIWVGDQLAAIFGGINFEIPGAIVKLAELVGAIAGGAADVAGLLGVSSGTENHAYTSTTPQPLVGAEALSYGGYMGNPERDFGGPGWAGQAYLIGTGVQPELFVPSTNGRFITPDQMGGGGGQVFQFNGAQFNLPNVQNAKQFFDELEREARRRNRQLAPVGGGVR